MTICGRICSMMAPTRAASVMSPITERTSPSTSDHRFGVVAGAKASPVTSAPSARSQTLIQAPLNPVCPVSSTLRRCQKELIRARPLLLLLLPIGCQGARAAAHPGNSEPATEPNLKIPELAQAANQQEYLLILAKPLRSIGNFQRITD